MALGVPGRLWPRIISTFGTTMMVGRQPHASVAFTPVEIPGTHFQRLSRPQGTRKESPVTPSGIDPGTVRLVVQRLNHYVTSDPTVAQQKNCKLTTDVMTIQLYH